MPIAELIHGSLVVCAALLGSVALQQTLSGALRRWRLRQDPLVSSLHDASFYQRSLLTFASRDVRRLWVLLAATALAAALALLWHGLFWLPAALLLAWALQHDLAHWECVAVSPWQIAWRRGWQRSIRRLPLTQVARVHLVERELSHRHGWLARWAGRPLGSCYLALELHNGRAVKLPRTDWLTGRAVVERAAHFLRQRQRSSERERRQSLLVRRQVRRDRSLRRPLEGRERTLQRELADLRRQRPREVYRLGRWPAPQAEMPADTGPDTLQISAPGDLDVPLYPPRRAHG